jgi:sugar lactone lactonase YvrE
MKTLKIAFAAMTSTLLIVSCKKDDDNPPGPSADYGLTSSLAGNGAIGSADGTGAAASFNYPINIAMDASGNMYVADRFNGKIRKITPAGVVTSLAGGGAGSSDGTGAAAGFQSPWGIVTDPAGNLYVTELYGNKVRKVTPAGVVTTIAGSGAQGSADGTGAAASFDYPSGIVMDGSGNLFVADALNRKIRKVTTAGVVTTFAGSGV